jgi:translation initiation factor 1
MHKKKENPLIYSTSTVSANSTDGETRNSDAGKQIAYIRREVKGRGGKTVTIISGLSLAPEKMARLATDLKKQCGSGGTVKNGIVIIQGDQRDKLSELLKASGYTVKLAGG